MSSVELGCDCVPRHLAVGHHQATCFWPIQLFFPHFDFLYYCPISKTISFIQLLLDPEHSNTITKLLKDDFFSNLVDFLVGQGLVDALWFIFVADRVAKGDRLKLKNRDGSVTPFPPSQSLHSPASLQSLRQPAPIQWAYPIYMRFWESQPAVPIRASITLPCWWGLYSFPINDLRNQTKLAWSEAGPHPRLVPSPKPFRCHHQAHPCSHRHREGSHRPQLCERKRSHLCRHARGQSRARLEGAEGRNGKDVKISEHARRPPQDQHHVSCLCHRERA